MVHPVRISVLICTYNRSQTLGVAVESIVVQSLPQSIDWEIVVVDNNSSDQTLQVIEALQRRYPDRIRYVFESQQGISHARNAGIRESQGEILAFLDDDETASADWLQNLTANLHTGEWAGAGGRVVPPSSFLPPHWLSIKSSYASGPLATFDLGSEPGQLNEAPFGANMAFRREVFDRFGGFRTDLGRAGKSMMSNEDTEFGRRLMAAGLRLRYEPSALTYHPVEEARLKKEYFLNWWFNKGRSDVRELGNQPRGKEFSGIPVRWFFALLWATMRWMVSVKPSLRFGHKVGAWNCAGQIYEAYNQRIDTGRKEQKREPSIGPTGIGGS